MRSEPSQSENGRQEARRWTIDGVFIYASKDEHGKPSIVDAIDVDERNIQAIADRLWNCGFGVMRQRNPRAGKVYFLLKAKWARPGDPPDDPFADI